MSYVKNTWASGDVITAQKLNNLENGVKDASDAGLPGVSGNTDKILVAGNQSAEWRHLDVVLDASNAHDGDVLSYDNSNGIHWAEAGEGGGLPDVSGHEDELLAAGYDGAEWRTLENALGANYASQGDMLTYDGNGLTWSVPAGLLPSGGSQGNVLVAGSASPEWTDTIGLLQASSANEGDVLTYNGSYLEWAASGLPSSGGTENDILALDDNGDPQWKSLEEILEASNAHEGDALTYDGSGFAFQPGVPDTSDIHQDSYLVWSSSNGLEWQSDVIPSHSSSDTGKVLGVNNAGGLEFRAGLPEWSGSDLGKFLYVSDCGSEGLNWGDPFPFYASSSYDGKVLAVTACNGYQLTWQEIIPPYDSDDAGKVLSVDEYGNLYWRTLS